MATHAEELKLILFLEGIQVPVIGANISMSSDFPASASIQIIATPEAFKLDVRTLVHLFFLDLNSKAKTSDFFSEPSPYSLLFCGEVTGINFSKSEGARSITLNCKDHRSYYDMAYTYLFKSKSLAGNSQTSSIEAMLKSKAAFAGANQHLLNFITEDGVAGFISKIFKDPIPTTPQFRNCRGVLGGVIKAIEAFTGLSSASTGGANAFFTFAEARLKLLGQLGVYSNDESSAKLLSSNHMMDLLKQKGDQLGDLASLNQVIRYILGFIYYRMTPNTCARFLPSTTFKTNATSQAAIKKFGETLDVSLRNVRNSLAQIRRLYRENLFLDTNNKEVEDKVVLNVNESLSILRAYMPEGFVSSITLTSETIKNSLMRSDTLDLIPTKEDTFSKEFSIGRVVSAIDWSIVDKHKWTNKGLYNLLKEVNRLKEAKDPAIKFFSKVVYELVRDLIQLLIGAPILSLTTNSMNENLIAVRFRQEQLKAARSGRYVAILDRLISHLSSISTGVTTEFSVQTSPKLYTTLILPDLFFSVAPKCNVLFPDMYYTASYSRDMSREVTRFQLSTTEDPGLFPDPAGVGKIHFYAPSTIELKDIQSKPLASNETSKAELAWTGNSLMDHELFSGIVPDFSQMSRMLLETALLSDVKKGSSKEARNDFYIRIANYQFLKKRLESRQLSVTGVFNPNAAVGFPMVVIDNAWMEGSGQKEQFIGLLVSLSHSVTQQGGSTSYQLSHVRPHRSKDDSFINSLNLGISTPPELATLDLNYTTILNEVANAYENATEVGRADIRSSGIFALNDACKKLVLMMSVTLHAGEKGKDFIVIEGSSLSSSTKDGDGLMEGKQVPSVPGPVKEGTKFDIFLDGDEELNGIKIAGIEVIDKTPCGGRQYAANNYRSAADLMKGVFGTIDPSVGLGDIKQGTRKVKKYIRSIANLTPEIVDEARGNLIRALAIKPVYWHKSPRSDRIGSFLHLPIGTLSPIELGRICKHYRDIGGRFHFTGFSSIRVYYEKKSSEVLTPPLEEAMRPSFVDSAYASPNIGEKVYKELLGVKSIVDIGESVIKNYKIPLRKTSVGYNGSSTGHGEILEVVSQEDAIDVLCGEYESSTNKSEFSREYIRRDIANLNDVIRTEASIHYKAFATTQEMEGTKEIPFMGMALEVGEGEPLIEGMRAATAEEVTIIEEAVDKRVDVRGQRHDTVLNYVESLTSRGLRG